ncbi:MAG: chorismate mutase, partial [Candidatus Bathyarchaeia archaeon]
MIGLEVNQLREKIRRIDSGILRLAKARLELVRQIGEKKKLLGLPITDLAVEREVIERATSLSEAIGLNKELALKLVGLLVWESVRIQGEVIPDRVSYFYEISEEAGKFEAKGEKVSRLDHSEPRFTIPSRMRE